DGELSAPCPLWTHVNISFLYSKPPTNNRSVRIGRRYDNTVAQTAIVAAQTSIRAIASLTSRFRSARTMNGKLAIVLRIGTRREMSTNQPTAYESTVATTIASAITRPGSRGTFSARVQTHESQGSCCALDRAERRRRRAGGLGVDCRAEP